MLLGTPKGNQLVGEENSGGGGESAVHPELCALHAVSRLSAHQASLVGHPLSPETPVGERCQRPEADVTCAEGDRQTPEGVV